MTRDGRLLVAERFGPTFQGEGPTAGQVALFIRLSRCNLSCSWCDTPYTWDWTRYDPAAESRSVHPDALAAWALGHDISRIVITGGEPLLQQTALTRLACQLSEAGRQVEIETNGTIRPTGSLVDAVEHFTVSPKLSGSGNPPDHRINPDALRTFATSGKAVFKFVVCSPGEFDEIAELEVTHGLRPIWVMPEATTSTDTLAGLQALADEALQRGWNLSPRLHLLLWENLRGH